MQCLHYGGVPFSRDAHRGCRAPSPLRRGGSGGRAGRPQVLQTVVGRAGMSKGFMAITGSSPHLIPPFPSSGNAEHHLGFAEKNSHKVNVLVGSLKRKTNPRPLHSFLWGQRGKCLFALPGTPSPPSRGLLVAPGALTQKAPGWVASRIPRKHQVRWRFVGRGRLSSHL